MVAARVSVVAPPAPWRDSDWARLLALTDSEKRLRELSNSVADVLWLYEPQSARFIHVSAAYEREWTHSAKALYADAAQWFARVHPDDRQRLQHAFKGLGADGGYAIDYRITSGGGQERWIEERAVPIERRSGQRLRVAGVSHDITARKTAELERLRSDRGKDQFLAMLAHELRSPLQPMRFAAALLARRHADGPATEQKAVAVIERQVDHLTRLVDDLLDLSRFVHGKMRLRAEVVRLADVIAAAVDANRALAERSRLSLRVELPADDVWLAGDSVRLTQIFTNLLDNASKFSVEGGAVTIGVRRCEIDGHVAVSVRDEGAGIAAEAIDTVFELFAQEERALSRNQGGLGIGLSLVREFAALHGGKVEARSAGIGQGSEFIVTLPTAAGRDVAGRIGEAPGARSEGHTASA